MRVENNKQFLTYEEAARELNTSFSYIAKLVSCKKLSSKKFEKDKHKYISSDDISARKTHAKHEVGNQTDHKYQIPDLLNTQQESVDNKANQLLFMISEIINMFSTMSKSYIDGIINVAAIHANEARTAITPLTNAIVANNTDSSVGNALLGVVNHMVANVIPKVEMHGVTDSTIDDIFNNMDLPPEERAKMVDLVKTYAAQSKMLTVSAA